MYACKHCHSTCMLTSLPADWDMFDSTAAKLSSDSPPRSPINKSYTIEEIMAQDSPPKSPAQRPLEVRPGSSSPDSRSRASQAQSTSAQGTGPSFNDSTASSGDVIPAARSAATRNLFTSFLSGQRARDPDEDVNPFVVPAPSPRPSTLSGPKSRDAKAQLFTFGASGPNWSASPAPSHRSHRSTPPYHPNPFKDQASQPSQAGTPSPLQQRSPPDHPLPSAINVNLQHSPKSASQPPSRIQADSIPPTNDLQRAPSHTTPHSPLPSSQALKASTRNPPGRPARQGPPSAAPTKSSKKKKDTVLKSRVVKHAGGKGKKAGEVTSQQHMPTTTPAPLVEDLIANPGVEPARRRSSRGSVPSKRQEQLQLIGSNVTQASRAIEKPENTDNAWFTDALEALQTYELGEEWTQVVKKWEALERILGQGTNTKVCSSLQPRVLSSTLARDTYLSRDAPKNGKSGHQDLGMGFGHTTSRLRSTILPNLVSRLGSGGLLYSLLSANRETPFLWPFTLTPAVATRRIIGHISDRRDRTGLSAS